jgi:hypothetical protein
MPNLLAIDCPDEFLLSMSKRSDWLVVIGFHHGTDIPTDIADKVSRPPDPLFWNLVGDDCLKNNEHDYAALLEHRIQFMKIPEGYIKECARAHGIRLCSSDAHLLDWNLAAAGGHRDLEFNAENDPRAPHLSDFLDSFERDFGRARIRYGRSTIYGQPWKPLYSDVYGGQLVVVDESGLSWLLMNDINDASRRALALEYLVTRTGPKLWGDVYSSHFQPKIVTQLAAERDSLIHERRERVRELDERIEEEQKFYAPFVNLLYVGDDALKSLVARAFSEVFGATVEDLDQSIPTGDPKRFDLRITFGGEVFCTEVRSRAIAMRGYQILRDSTTISTAWNLQRDVSISCSSSTGCIRARTTNAPSLRRFR